MDDKNSVRSSRKSLASCLFAILSSFRNATQNSGGIVITPIEARLLLDKWAREETLLLCRGIFRGVSFSLTGTLSFLPAGQGCITSRKGEAKTLFDIDDSGILFEYVERRTVADDMAEEFAELGGVVIMLPPRFSKEEFRAGIIGPRDRLTISELHSSEVKSN
jgi:hypothetical protein